MSPGRSMLRAVRAKITGYTDRELAPGRWRVTFSGNSVTPSKWSRIILAARRRSDAGGSGGTHFIFDYPYHPRQQTAPTQTPSGPATRALGRRRRGLGRLLGLPSR